MSALLYAQKVGTSHSNRGSVSLRGNSSRRNGMHRMGVCRGRALFSQENLVAFLFGDISRSLAVPVLCVHTYTHALHKN